VCGIELRDLRYDHGGQPATSLVVVLQANKDVEAAGMVINTMGWIEDLGYDLLLHSIDTLKANVVLVVGQDRLYNQLGKHLK
jgi:polyribonucleotide 5'-hydroxyl-kinase